MNHLCKKPIGNRKTESGGKRLGIKTSLGDFWKPSRPFSSPILMSQKSANAGTLANLEQMAPVNAPAYPLAILVVEDNRINRMLTMKMLNYLGYAADAVINGRECMQAMAEKTYELYLMDLQMPVMDGFTAAREIRRWHQVKTVKPPPYICALTANVLPRDREACLAAGMDDFLTKPLRLETLRIVVNRVVENLKNFRPETGQEPRT
jgi:CheY-like chemotaxis protein